VRWFGDPKAEYRADPTVSIGDPALAEYLGIGHLNDAGVSITETSSMELSAVWRSVLLISGTIAGLPLHTYRRTGSESREEISSFLDAPHPDMSPFEWKELVMAHELLWGDSFLHHLTGGAGQLLGLTPLPPWSVGVKRDENTGEKLFSVRDAKGDLRELTSVDLTHIPAFSLDGLRGLSPIGQARHSLGAAKASDKAAGRMFRNGLQLAGILTPKSDALTKTQSDQVLAGLRGKAGADHAGDIAFLPAAVSFSPWTMNAIDAQFLESRHFGIEECSRWFGVPRELLSESGASSWGSGIQEIVRGFARFCLAAWTTRIEQRLSMLLPKNQFCEFDYSKFLKPSPETEIRLLIEQVNAKLLTVNEARAIRNLPPLSDAELAAMQPDRQTPTNDEIGAIDAP
jgi:HK97 family phage portal protein